MTIETLPLGRGQEAARENPLSKATRAVKDWIKEATGPRRKRKIDIVAFYLGITMAHEVNNDRMTEGAVEQKIKGFESAGIPIKRTVDTYRYFRSHRGTFTWFDIGFQIETLERFLPEVLERAKQSGEKSD